MVKSLKKLKPVLFVAMAASFMAFGCSDDAEEETTSSGEGSSAAPIALTLDTAHSGSTGGGKTSYYSFTPAASGTYNFTIVGAGAAANVLLENPSTEDKAYASGNDCTDCSVALQALTKDKVYGISLNAANSAISYSLTVTKGKGDGSLLDPVALTLDESVTSGIEVNGNAYFTFSPAVRSSYKAVISSSGNASGGMTSSEGHETTKVSNSCTGQLQSLTCMISVEADSSPNFRVYNTGSVSGDFDLILSLGKNNTTEAHPLALTTTPQASGNDGVALLYSYFTFNTDATNANYYLNFSTDEASALSVQQYRTTASTAHSNVQTVTCETITPTGGTAHKECLMTGLLASQEYVVTSIASTGYPASYNVSAHPSLQAGSTGAPLALTVGTSFSGGVRVRPQASSVSYYKFTATATTNTLIISNINVDYDYAVFPLAGGAAVKASTTVAANNALSQAITGLTNGTEYKISVTVNAAVSGNGDKGFSIKVQ